MHSGWLKTLAVPLCPHPAPAQLLGFPHPPTGTGSSCGASAGSRFSCLLERAVTVASWQGSQDPPRTLPELRGHCPPQSSPLTGGPGSPPWAAPVGGVPGLMGHGFLVCSALFHRKPQGRRVQKAWAWWAQVLSRGCVGTVAAACRRIHTASHAGKTELPSSQ